MVTPKKYRKIILVSGSGSSGSVLLGGLLSEPRFNVTVLARESSKFRSTIASQARVITVLDFYPLEGLIHTFKDQDVVVNALTSTSLHEQFRFIDASIEAGVKRYTPSEYGLNNRNFGTRQLSPVFNDKGAVQEYLKSKESTGLTWTAIVCGMWMSWSLKHEFLGPHPKDREIVPTNEIQGFFSTTTMSNTALALNRALPNPEKTVN